MPVRKDTGDGRLPGQGNTLGKNTHLLKGSMPLTEQASTEHGSDDVYLFTCTRLNKGIKHHLINRMDSVFLEFEGQNFVDGPAIRKGQRNIAENKKRCAHGQIRLTITAINCSSKLCNNIHRLTCSDNNNCGTQHLPCFAVIKEHRCQQITLQVYTEKGLAHCSSCCL